MKRIFLTLSIWAAAGMYGKAFSQFHILFVNDNAYTGLEFNTDTVLADIMSTPLLADVDYWNAVDSAAGPDVFTMNSYHLVIWYAGPNGIDLHFWNQTDTDNPDVAVYLANGGALWVIGTDVLYDRYGPAPFSFSPGDFVYDYMGIASYDAQSYADDGGTGCPMAVLDSIWPPILGPPIPYGPDTLTWIFPTTWYIDGVTLAPSGTSWILPMYDMGPSSYSLSGSITESFCFRSSSPYYRVLSTLFNPYEIDNSAGQRTLYFQKHLEFWGGMMLGNSSSAVSEPFTFYPNPASGQVHFSAPCSWTLSDLTGRELLRGQASSSANVEDLPSGMYLLRDLETGATGRLLVKK